MHSLWNVRQSELWRAPFAGGWSGPERERWTRSSLRVSSVAVARRSTANGEGPLYHEHVQKAPISFMRSKTCTGIFVQYCSPLSGIANAFTRNNLTYELHL